MPYVQLFYHLVWATKYRAPLLTPSVEPTAHRLIRAKAEALGAWVYALDGIDDHIHLVVSIPPKLAVATFVGQIKGASSAQINKLYFYDGQFSWQDEYGAFSFDRQRLPNFVAYVQGQKAHHLDSTTIPVLERDDGPYAIQEHPIVYGYDDPQWRSSLESLLD